MQQPRPPSWAFFPRRKGPTQTDEQFRSDQLVKSIYETNEETPVQPADSDAMRTCPTRRRSDASRSHAQAHTHHRQTANRARGTDAPRHSRPPAALRGSGPTRPSRGAARDSGSGDHGEWPRTRTRQAQGARCHPWRLPETWWPSATPRGSACGCETRFCVPLLLALRHCGRVCITCQYCSVRPEQSERCKTTSSCE